ncbi:MAG: YihY/virulence factor BrkB family protein [Acidimicrobiia bacterium]|nr:YihY/virulence factor BrkB family protein [Acidimicrobiia bacterium]
MATSDDVGRSADAPEEIPPKGWLAAATRMKAEVKADHVTLMAAGVAFYGFLAIIPGLVAVVSVYGLFGDPDTVQARVEDMAGSLPEEARNLLVEQLEAITGSSSSALTVGLVISLGAALWAASSGMGHLIEAVNLVYDEDESRGFAKLRGLALVLTLGAVVFGIAAIAAITVWPAVVAAVDPPSPFGLLLRLAVWPVLALGLSIALAVLYRYGPDRENAEWRWVSWGSGIAVLLWLVASIAFQFYAGNFGSYNETYGSLGAVVLLLMWLWISAVATLVGAEINSQLELETADDSTTGPERPMGSRGAEVADRVTAS